MVAPTSLTHLRLGPRQLAYCVVQLEVIDRLGPLQQLREQLDVVRGPPPAPGLLAQTANLRQRGFGEPQELLPRVELGHVQLERRQGNLALVTIGRGTRTRILNDTPPPGAVAFRLRLLLHRGGFLRMAGISARRIR
eukprot:1188563-Prorocentrum_minimum.AAC.2